MYLLCGIKACRVFKLSISDVDTNKMPALVRITTFNLGGGHTWANITGPPSRRYPFCNISDFYINTIPDMSHYHIQFWRGAHMGEHNGSTVPAVSPPLEHFRYLYQYNACFTISILIYFLIL